MNRVPAAVIIAALFLAALPLYLAGNTANPPGFFADEASIAYNAMRISRDGVDEFGYRMPLYFRSGDDYKSPVYIYVLAAVFRVTGASRAAARDLSGILGDLTAAAMAWLAWMLTARRWIAAAAFAAVFATPALFEISRLVFEVALFPLVFVLFLIAVLRASRRERWSAADVFFLAATVSLCTYTYAIGRLYAPLLLAGVCVFFYTRQRRNAIIALVAIYAAMTIVPMMIYHYHHYGAMTMRFRSMTYLDEPLPHVVRDFTLHYLEDFDPIGQSLTGDPIERHHVRDSGGSILAGTFVLAFLGVGLAGARANPWQRFLIYALVLSIVPAALLSNPMHTLRLVSYPLLLIVFAAIAAAEAPKTLLAVAAVLIVLQSAWFFAHFIRDGGERTRAFQAACEPATAVAIAQPMRPIYLIGHFFAIDSIWYGSQRGAGANNFIVRDPTGVAPSGAIAVTNWIPPRGARELYHHDGFWTYIAP